MDKFNRLSGLCFWLGISLRFILIAFHQPRNVEYIHLSTGNSNHVYTYPATSYTGCVCCCVRFHAFQMQTPKTTTTTRRWNQHVRSFAERGKTLNNLFNKNILMLRANEQNTLKSAYKRSTSELLQHLLIFIMSCEV